MLTVFARIGHGPVIDIRDIELGVWVVPVEGGIVKPARGQAQIGRRVDRRRGDRPDLAENAQRVSLDFGILVFDRAFAVVTARC